MEFNTLADKAKDRVSSIGWKKIVVVVCVGVGLILWTQMEYLKFMYLQAIKANIEYQQQTRAAEVERLIQETNKLKQKDEEIKDELNEIKMDIRGLKVQQQETSDKVEKWKAPEGHAGYNTGYVDFRQTLRLKT